MSKLYHSLDVDQYDFKTDTYYIEGWAIAQNRRKTEIRVIADHKSRIHVDVEQKARPDIAKVLKNTEVPAEPGFRIGIKNISQILKKYNTLDVLVGWGRERTSVGKRTAEAMRKVMTDYTIISEIDVVRMASGYILIHGWAIDQCREDHIDVVDEYGKPIPCEMFRAMRKDVNIQHKLEADRQIGFNIKISRKAVTSKKIVVRFYNSAASKEFTVDVKKLDFENSTRGKLWENLRPANFKRNKTMIAEHGFGSFVEHMKTELIPEYSNYHNWMLCHQPGKEEISRQRMEQFPYHPVISIVIPLYNTPIKYLKEIVESIRTQTYPHWELCLADGSSEDEVEKFIRSHYKDEKRIVYKRLEDNTGISGNTNAAVAMATGEYIMLSDHDDVVEQGALYEIAKALNRKKRPDVIYTDEDKISMDGKYYFDPHFKPDYNPYLLRSSNYICHIFVVKKSIVDEAGLFQSEFDGAQDYDFILRCCEKAQEIYHIPKVLYHWRSHPNSTAGDPESKRYAYEAGRKALQEHYRRLGIEADVEHASILGRYRTRYKLQGTPKVSVLIPNKDHTEDLEVCLSSIAGKTTYENYEILVAENNSEDPATFAYYEEMVKRYPKTRVINWESGFNYAAINNFAAKEAAGDYYLLLNNDVEIITPDWMEEMLSLCQREDVGIVGAKLFYPDDTVQHAGVIIGMGGVAGHIFSGLRCEEYGYAERAVSVHNLSAVTAACLMIDAKVFEEIEGFDEGFAVAFNDVDLCMKVTAAGYGVVFDPYVQLYHYESKSRGPEDTLEKQARLSNETVRFERKWPEILEKGDPYYNENLTLSASDCSLR